MMTYRTGAAGAPSTALAMAQHLLQQTLPADKADVAAYYLRSMKGPSQADETLAAFAELVASGGMTREAALEALVSREIERAAASPMAEAAQPGRPSDATTEALGKVVAAGLMDREEAAVRLAQPAQAVPAPEAAQAAHGAALGQVEAQDGQAAPPLPQGPVRRRVVSQEEAQRQFAEALQLLGLSVRGGIVADGQSHYCQVSGKRDKKNKSGLYRVTLGERPHGFIANFATGESMKWSPEGGTLKTVSPEEHAAELERAAAARLKTETDRQAREHAVAIEAGRVWDAAAEATSHPYLTKKGVGSHGLRVGAPGLTLKIRNELGETYDLHTKGKLLVPMRDVDGKLWSLQLIEADGTKKYLGGGRRQGTFAVLGDLSGDQPLAIGEGYATVATVQEAMPVVGVAAFDGGGLMAAVQAFRGRFPDRPIVLAADNDHHLPRRTPPMPNVGLEKATKAAQSIAGAAVVAPAFQKHENGSDWNDWAAKHGRDGLAPLFAPAIAEAQGAFAMDRERRERELRAMTGEAIAGTLDDAVAWAMNARESGGTVARVRPGTHPLLVERLGLPTTRPLVASEVANLLNGTRTDGAPVPGKQVQKPTLPLTELLELSSEARPVREDIAHILAGRTAKGNPLEGKAGASATRRFLTKFGCKGNPPTAIERGNLLDGNMADGAPVTHHDYIRRVDSSKARVGYIDLTFSAPKSFSVAWALEPTDAGRAILDQVFNEAVAATLRHVETHLGQARQGKGGKGGYMQGSLTWVEFDHYASRPTVAIVQHDGWGRPYTERVTVKDGGLIPADPQRHKHCLLPNTVLAPDGRMVGLELQRLDERIHEFGAYFQWQLSAGLKKQGVAVELDERTKMARLSGVDEPICELFSKRTTNGTEAAREYAASLGLEWDKLSAERQVGLLKQGVQGDHNQARRMGLGDQVGRQLKRDGISDWASWEQQAKDAGYEHVSVLHRDAPRVEQTPEIRAELLEKSYQVALDVLEEEFEKRAGLSGGDLRVAALRGLIATGLEGDEDELKAITRRMVTHGVRQDGLETMLSYGKARVRGREVVRATTELHVTREVALIDLAQRAEQDRSAALSPAQIKAAVAVWTARPVAEGGLRFTDDHGLAQREMIDRLGTGGRLAVLVGVAGSGKSALLRPLVTAWEDQGSRVFGIALAWRQADAFRGTGVKPWRSKAIQAFLVGVEKGRVNLTAKDVVVVDEVGLVGTRQLLELLELRASIGFSMVLLGDPKQCQSIEAGPVISLLERALGEAAVPRLLSTTRQLTQDEQETTGLFREGKAEEALVRKRENKTLEVVPGDYTAAVRATAERWQALRDASAHDPSYTVSVSAPTNRDARMIAMAIRDKRRERGELGQDVVRIEARDQSGQQYDLRLAVGDRVRLFDSVRASFTDGRVGNVGRNASVLEVLDFRGPDKGQTAAIKMRNVWGNEAWVSYDALRGKDKGRVRLTYGDVLTTNSAQGETVDDHIHSMPGGTQGVNGFAAYTSGSRHRRSTYVITSDGAERDEVARRRPLGDQRPVRDWDVLQNMARNLSRQPEKTSALAILEMVGKVQQNVARGLQQTMHRAEEREREGLDRSELPDRYEDSHAHEGLETLGETLGEMTRAQARGTERMQDLGRSMRKAVERGMERLSPALVRALEARRERLLARSRDTGQEL